MPTTRVRSLSLPSDLVREAERLAKQEGRTKTKTEVLREALAATVRSDVGVRSSAMAPAGLGKSA